MSVLERTLEDLYEKEKLDANEISAYLDERERMSALAFRLGRKLGVKIGSVETYVDVYVEKWCNYGFEDSSLLDIALFCLKTERGSFESMNALLDDLFAQGIISSESVAEFLKEKNGELKLFAKIQEACGAIRKNATNLALIRTWRSWNFTDEMIIESAKRSCASASPIPYMNKVLADWKRQEIFTLSAIPDAPATNNTNAKPFVSPAVQAVNAKADRERYYALLKEKAQKRADKFVAKANENPKFKQVATRLSKLEIELAKADIFSPEKLPALAKEKANLLATRAEILAQMGIEERDLTVQYTCPKCKDSGFLSGGGACDCYRK